MASDLISIAKSGTRAARVALDVTAQNIANASSEGYVRRSATVSEIAAGSVMATPTAINLNGVHITGIVRNADQFRQAEVRRTGADAARADAELQGLENVEVSIEQTGVYDSIVSFEASLQQLLSDPTDSALRTQVLEQGRIMGQTLNASSGALDAVGEGLRFEAADGIDQVNGLATELARVNLRLARASDSSSDQTSLLDQRDLLLQKMSAYVDIKTTFATDKTVTVTVGGTGGGTLVNAGVTSTLASTTNPDGTLDFTLDGNALTLTSGSLAGKALALEATAQTHSQLDTIASTLVSTVNAAQAGGVDLAGNTGQPLFSGSTAADITMIATSPGTLATAPAGAAANSRDTGNLVALRSALDSADPAGKMDTLLFTVSSTVAGRTVTRGALDSIASTAKVALQSQAGVDLDEETVNLVRFQQAFQASGRVIQVANDIFDSLLAIR